MVEDDEFDSRIPDLIGPAPDRDLYAAIFDSLEQHIALVDPHGTIQWVNQAWIDYSLTLGHHPTQPNHLASYFAAWQDAQHTTQGAHENAPGTDSVRGGLHAVLSGRSDGFYYEYACDAGPRRRWFMTRVRPLRWVGPKRFIVSHQDITERKIAELRIGALATTDALTGVANRRRLDDFLTEEFQRARRNRTPVSITLFDVDHFKAFNDHYGHPCGDRCLRKIGELLGRAERRASDLAARYGGEEFALVLGATNTDGARAISERLRQQVQRLGIPHATSPIGSVVTMSAGIATTTWDGVASGSVPALLEAADRALYRAKAAGRNQICSDVGDSAGSRCKVS